MALPLLRGVCVEENKEREQPLMAALKAGEGA
jgi:hypothetical protein